MVNSKVILISRYGESHQIYLFHGQDMNFRLGIAKTKQKRLKFDFKLALFLVSNVTSSSLSMVNLLHRVISCTHTFLQCTVPHLSANIPFFTKFSSIHSQSDSKDRKNYLTPCRLRLLPL